MINELKQIVDQNKHCLNSKYILSEIKQSYVTLYSVGPHKPKPCKNFRSRGDRLNNYKYDTAVFLTDTPQIIINNINKNDKTKQYKWSVRVPLHIVRQFGAMKTPRSKLREIVLPIEVWHEAVVDEGEEIVHDKKDLKQTIIDSAFDRSIKKITHLSYKKIQSIYNNLSKKEKRYFICSLSKMNNKNIMRLIYRLERDDKREKFEMYQNIEDSEIKN